MATGFCDPNSDIANSPAWYANKDLNIALRKVGDGPDGININGDPIGRGTGETATLEMNMATFTLDGSMTKVTVYVYINGMQQSTIYANIYVDGAWQTRQTVYAVTDYEAPGWKQVDFTGTWNQTDLDNLQIRIEATATTGNQGGCYIDVVTGEITDGSGTTLVLPNGDASNTKFRWSATGDGNAPTTNLYTMIDDGIRYPTVPSNYWDKIYLNTGDSYPGTTYGYTMGMTTIANVDSVEEVKIWVYIDVENRNNIFNVAIYMGGGWRDAQLILDYTESDVQEWRSVTFDGTGLGWTQTDLNNLQVNFSCQEWDGWLGVPATYAEVTYTPAAATGWMMAVMSDE